MAALYTIPETIEIADLSVCLAGNNNAKGSLFGNRLANPISPVEIAMSVDALRWQYEGDPTDTTLRGFANYVIWECGRYAQEAQYIIAGGTGGGGSVLPPGGVRGNYYVITADVTSTDPDDGTPAIGSFVYTNSLMVGATQLAYIIVNSQIETIASGAFTFNQETGTIQRVNAWQDQDQVQIPFVRA